jgi:hypothetical protein
VRCSHSASVIPGGGRRDRSRWSRSGLAVLRGREHDGPQLMRQSLGSTNCRSKHFLRNTAVQLFWKRCSNLHDSSEWSCEPPASRGPWEPCSC